jgi:hypothetical protein
VAVCVCGRSKVKDKKTSTMKRTKDSKIRYFQCEVSQAVIFNLRLPTNEILSAGSISQPGFDID